MHVQLDWLNGVAFEAKSDAGHSVLMDGPEATGGRNLGMRPMELLPMGIGGCTSYDVITILRKSRQNVTNCAIHLDAKRADTTPQVFEQIHIRFLVSGHNLDDKKVARAVALSADKYCSASIMMQRADVVVTHDYEIIEQPELAAGATTEANDSQNLDNSTQGNS